MTWIIGYIREQETGDTWKEKDNERMQRQDDRG
jgi:hypothetical protein